jgi:hypothetical protein
LDFTTLFVTTLNLKKKQDRKEGCNKGNLKIILHINSMYICRIDDKKARNLLVQHRLSTSKQVRYCRIVHVNEDKKSRSVGKETFITTIHAHGEFVERA